MHLGSGRRLTTPKWRPQITLWAPRVDRRVLEGDPTMVHNIAATRNAASDALAAYRGPHSDLGESHGDLRSDSDPRLGADTDPVTAAG